MAGTTYVHNFGVEALMTSVGSPVFKVNIDRALFMGRDATTGEWIKATNATGAEVRALSFVVAGSLSKAGVGHQYNPDRPAYAGKPQTKEKYGDLVVPDNTFTMAEVAQNIAIYLGIDGAWTKTKPTGVGTLVQIVGRVDEHNIIKVNLEHDPQGVLATA